MRWIIKNPVSSLVLLILLLSLILLPFRYKVTGTNQGYIYKTDRLTGKTFIITPSGEKEIGSPPTPVATPEDFPIVLLDIISVKNSTSQYGNTEVQIRNNSAKTARNIILKVTYSDTKNGPVVDTEYVNIYEVIEPQDTVSVIINTQSQDRWYSVRAHKATY